MPRREFANQKALIDHAERTGDVYLREGTPGFAKRRRILSPDQHEIVDVCTSRGVRRAMLTPKAILQAKRAIKREQLRAKRPTKQRSI